MKNLYKFLLALLMVAASVAGNKAKAQNQSYFEYSTNCLKVTLWATDKRAFDSCAQTKFSLNGTYVTGPQATYTFPAAGTYSVCLKIYNSCKKWDTTICKSITVKACNKCDWSKAAWSYKVDCRKLTFEGNNLLGACYKYSWAINGTTINSRVGYYNFAKDGVYKVCMKVYDSCNKCDTTICKEITIKCTNECELKPDFVWSSDCLKIKMSSTNNIAGATYWWSFGDGYYGSAKDVYHNYLKTGVYTICLKMVWKDPNTGKECIASVCKEVKISCGNDCNLKGDFKFGTNGNLVKFQASSNNGVYYSWNFGDGTTGSGANPTHYYKKPGTYNVCVTIYDKTKKCSVKICKKVVIEEPCNVRAYFKWTANGNTVKFNGLAYNGVYYVWSFGDGTSGTGKDPSHTYSKPGTYKVCLTVYSKNEKCKTTICKEVVVRGTDKCNWSKLGVDFYYAVKCPNLILEGKNLNNNNTGCYSYGWSVTPVNTNQSTYFYGRVQNIVFSTNGVFNVCMKVYDSCRRCDTIICKTITVNCAQEKCNWSKAGFGYNLNCKKGLFEANYPGSNTGCYKYNWSINGKYFTGRIAEYAFPANGTYEVCLKVIDTCHKCDTIICKKVVVNCSDTRCDWSKAAWSYKLDCKKLVFEGNNLTDSCYSYSWSINGTVINGRVGYYNFTTNGIYKVCMKVTNNCHSCDTTICKEIKVDCNPCSWTGNGFYYKVDCNKVYLEGKVTNNTCVKYVYYTGNSFIGGGRLQNYTFTKNGSYDICMKVYDTCKKCDTVICQTVKIDCQPCKAQAKFTVDSTTSGGVAYITNNSTGASYYSWDYGDNTFGYSKDPGKHAYAASGSYTICLTVYDSAKTCSTKYCVTIKVVKTRAASVSETSKVSNIKIYPNPADAYFLINTSGEIGTYEVVNLQGKSIASGVLNAETRVSTAEWSEGVYLVRSTLSDGTTTTRLVVTRQ